MCGREWIITAIVFPFSLSPTAVECSGHMSRPDSGLGLSHLQVKVLNPVSVFPSPPSCRCAEEQRRGGNAEEE